MKNEQTLGFADFLTAKRKIKQEFFNQVNLIVDWRSISNIKTVANPLTHR